MFFLNKKSTVFATSCESLTINLKIFINKTKNIFCGIFAKCVYKVTLFAY